MMKLSVVILILVGILYVLIEYYPFIFSRTVTGEVISVERVDAPMAIINTAPGEEPPRQVFSFSVGIEDKRTGEIVVASSEDRRWASVSKGQCATARYFPYPPWRVDKRDTYFNVRLITLMKSCDKNQEEPKQ